MCLYVAAHMQSLVFRCTVGAEDSSRASGTILRRPARRRPNSLLVLQWGPVISVRHVNIEISHRQRVQGRSFTRNHCFGMCALSFPFSQFMLLRCSATSICPQCLWHGPFSDHARAQHRCPRLPRSLDFARSSSVCNCCERGFQSVFETAQSPLSPSLPSDD